MKKQILLPIFGGLSVIILLTCFGGRFRSIDATIAWMNGTSFCIEPKTVDLGDQEPGHEQIVSFYLKNLTSKEISVVGEKSSCSCAFSENIPISARPMETVELKVRVRLPKFKSNYDQTILFMVATSKKLEMSPVRIVAAIPYALPDSETETKIPKENAPTSESDANDETSLFTQTPVE